MPTTHVSFVPVLVVRKDQDKTKFPSPSNFEVIQDSKEIMEYEELKKKGKEPKEYLNRKYSAYPKQRDMAQIFISWANQ